ncbi:hypothetical protein J4421_02790 [Candidatus Woesearchaeota archaeon]|nr:hypothetical protein [Candidatus Woesearchaeota archaeon]
MTILYALYQRPFLLAVIFSIIFLWTMIWKGIALWYAAKYRQKGWFVVLLFLQTSGVMEIIYLFFFRGRRKPAEEERKSSKTVTIKTINSKDFVSKRKKSLTEAKS